MKFPVAPQSMRVVVMTVLVLYCRRIGNRIACSDWLATSTEVMMGEEDDVEASSCFKKTPPLFHQHLQQVGVGGATHQVSFPFFLTL